MCAGYQNGCEGAWEGGGREREPARHAQRGSAGLIPPHQEDCSPTRGARRLGLLVMGHTLGGHSGGWDWSADSERRCGQSREGPTWRNKFRESGSGRWGLPRAGDVHMRVAARHPLDASLFVPADMSARHVHGQLYLCGRAASLNTLYLLTWGNRMPTHLCGTWMPHHCTPKDNTDREARRGRDGSLPSQ